MSAYLLSSSVSAHPSHNSFTRSIPTILNRSKLSVVPLTCINPFTLTNEPMSPFVKAKDIDDIMLSPTLEYLSTGSAISKCSISKGDITELENKIKGLEKQIDKIKDKH